MKPALNITCIICSLDVGGAQRNLLRLVEVLGRQGHSVCLLTLDPNAPDFYEVPLGIKRLRADPLGFIRRHWAHLPGHWKRLRALRHSILATQPDLVISFIDTTNVDVLIALRNAKVPVIVSERVDPRFHDIGWPSRLLRWWSYPAAAMVVLVAAASLVWARRFIPRWRVTVIPNPVVLPAARTNYLSDSKQIVAMGRVVPQKGFDLLVTAFAALAGDHPDWVIKIIGDGPERDLIKAQARQYGLEDRVMLLGAQHDPFSIMAQSSFFVLSSKYEGFPMALAEAMALGLPVISFDCPSGPGELIRSEKDGLLVPVEDTHALSAAMRRLIEDPTLRRRLSKNACEVCDRFPMTAYAQKWTYVVDAVMNTSG